MLWTDDLMTTQRLVSSLAHSFIHLVDIWKGIFLVAEDIVVTKTEKSCLLILSLPQEKRKKNIPEEDTGDSKVDGWCDEE